MASDPSVDRLIDQFLRASSAPIVDIRDPIKFVNSHLVDSVNIPAVDLFDRLNELPPKSQPIRLVGEGNSLEASLKVFGEKGFAINAWLNWDDLLLTILARRQLIETGNNHKRLWQPATIIKKFINEYDRLKPPKKALDLACGSGRDAVYLALNGWQVTAIDYLPQLLDKLNILAQNQNVKVDTVAFDIEKESEKLLAFAGQMDLVVVIRYLHRPLFNIIPQLIKPGGCIVYQTFMQGCELIGRPRNPNFLLKPKELANVFQGFNVLIDQVEKLSDGRPTNVFIAQKPAESS